MLTDVAAPADMVRALAGRGVDVRLVAPDQVGDQPAGDGSGATRTTR